MNKAPPRAFADDLLAKGVEKVTVAAMIEGVTKCGNDSAVKAAELVIAFLTEIRKPRGTLYRDGKAV